MIIKSYKKLKELHSSLGGNKKGFFIIRHGQCMLTHKPVSVISTIATHHPRNANWSYHLVQGKFSNW